MITNQEFDQIARFGQIAVVEQGLSSALTKYRPDMALLYVCFSAANSDGEDMIFEIDHMVTAMQKQQFSLVNYLTGDPYRFSLGNEKQFALRGRVFHSGAVNIVPIIDEKFIGYAPIAVKFHPNASMAPVSTEFMSFSGFDSHALIRGSGPE